MEATQFVQRQVLAIARQRAAESPVLLLEGPRSVGKSTVLRELARDVPGPVLDLDDPIAAADAAASPSSFLPPAQRVYLDEYQRAPALLDSIKARLNQDGRPGQFVLAGSTSFNALPVGTQSLTGRLHRLQLLPLSQAEIEGRSHSVLAGLFDDPDAELAQVESAGDRLDYVRRVVVGGFPLALSAATDAARRRWFADYEAQTILRDLPQVDEVRRPDVLRRLLGLIAARTGQILNLSSLAELSGTTPRTVGNYLSLLSNAFVVHQLLPWMPVPTDRAFRKPKIHILDSGVAAHLLRLSTEKLAERTAGSLTAFGHLLESFVVAELVKEASWLDDVSTVGYWRTYEGAEIDLVVERFDGAVVAFEIKAAQRLKDGDLAGLRAVRDKVGDAFRAGVVLHTGYRSANPEDRLYTMPIDHLWTAEVA